MRKGIMIGLIVMTLVITCAAGEAQSEKRWISLDGSVSASRPAAEVLVSNDSETVIRFTIPGFWLDTISEEGVTYDVLRFPGYSTTQDIGKAELPVISELLAIPAKAGVRASIVGFEETLLTGYNIYPYQRPLDFGEKRASLEIDHGFYRLDELYPEPVAAGKPGIWRDLRVVDIHVAPIRYNPARNELVAYANVTVRLDYAGESAINEKRRPVTAVRPEHAAMYSQNVLNYDELDVPISGAPPEDGYDLLIIAEDRYIDNLGAFVEYKSQRGFRVKTVAASTIGYEYTAFKSFLQNEYDENQFSYCLFVSNGFELNGVDFHPITDGLSDYRYTLLEGDDLYPDIGIGRFPVWDEIQLQNMINKTITYESNPPADDWLEKVLLVASKQIETDTFQPDVEEIRAGTYTYSGTYYDYYPPQFVTAYGESEALGGDAATNQDVIDYIDEGMRVVFYFGHGDYTEWWNWGYYGDSFSAFYVTLLDNGYKTPIVIAIACKTALPNSKDTFLGQSFVLEEDGAVAYYGATVTTNTMSVFIGQESLALIYDRGISTISDATNMATVSMIMKDAFVGKQVADDYIWYGDPTLRVIPDIGGTSPPDLLYPEWAASIEFGTQIVLDWDDVGKIKEKPNNTLYHLQLDDNHDFSSPILEINLWMSERAIDELEQGVYYWRVRSCDGGVCGAWSETRHFFVDMPTAVTTLLGPEDGGILIIGTVAATINWTNPLDPDEYLVQIDDDSDFNSPIVSDVTHESQYGVYANSLPSGTYYWRVCGRSIASWPWSETWSFQFGESSNEGKGNSDKFESDYNHPNPFNPSTVIRFEMPRSGNVRLDVYNVKGQLVATLVDGFREEGVHEVLWDGRNSKGVQVGSGMYFYRLLTGAMVKTRKMLLIK